MSILFHEVTISCPTDDITFLIGGSAPTCEDDLCWSGTFCDFCYDNQGEEMEVEVHVESYLTPDEGETKAADDEDVERIKDLIKQDPTYLASCDNLSDNDFTFLMKPVNLDDEE